MLRRKRTTVIRCLICLERWRKCKESHESSPRKTNWTSVPYDSPRDYFSFVFFHPPSPFHMSRRTALLHVLGFVAGNRVLRRRHQASSHERVRLAGPTTGLAASGPRPRSEPMVHVWRWDRHGRGKFGRGSTDYAAGGSCRTSGWICRTRGWIFRSWDIKSATHR